jgi:hypothetical protein
MAPDPTFAFAGGLSCLTLDFVFALILRLRFTHCYTSEKELDSLSEWVKSIKSILKSRIKHVLSKMRTNYPSAFNKPEVIRE